MEKTAHETVAPENVAYKTIPHETVAHETIEHKHTDEDKEHSTTDPGAIEHANTDDRAREKESTDNDGAIEHPTTDHGAIEHATTEHATTDESAREKESTSHDEAIEHETMETAISWKEMAIGRLTAVGEWIASRPLGQSMVKVGDKMLMVLEHSVRWFVPEQPIRGQSNGSPYEEPNKHVGDLVRPLPWYMFLPFLMVLRMTNSCICGSAWVLGKEPVHPREVVTFLQRQRRSLRAIKFQGLKNMRLASVLRASVKSEGTEENLDARPTCILTRLIKFARLGPVMVYIGYWTVSVTQEDDQDLLIVRKRKFEEVEKNEESDKSTEGVQDTVRPYKSDSTDPDFDPASEFSDKEDEQQTEAKSAEAEDKSVILPSDPAPVPTPAAPESSREEDSEDERSSSSTLSTGTTLLEDGSNATNSLSRTSSGKDIYYSPIGSERNSPEPVQVENINDRPRAKSMEPGLPIEITGPQETDADSLKSFTSAKSAESITSDSTQSGAESTSNIKGKLAKFFPRRKQTPLKQNAS